jgi:hypothetical protein
MVFENRYDTHNLILNFVFSDATFLRHGGGAGKVAMMCDDHVI